jgi:lipoprotein NlpD
MTLKQTVGLPLCAWFCIVLTGCASTTPVPVVDRLAAPQASAPVNASPKLAAGMYRVKKGDTLYSIALDHGRDYKELAEWNHLDNVNLIQVDQLLRVASPEADGSQVAVAKPVTSEGVIKVKPANSTEGKAGEVAAAETVKHSPKGGKEPFTPDALARVQAEEAAEKSPAGVVVTKAPVTTQAAAPKAAEPQAVESKAAASRDWVWPATGKLLATFNDSSSKGVDIAGKVGDPVLAAADGTVSYVGTGLRGYGNLVVLRHDATWLSVYAHNSQILVKEKQSIKRGQKIALMGASDAASPRLHFEIRQQGKPVDPQKLLPAK